MACRDDSCFVSRNRTSNTFFPARVSKQKIWWKENPRHDGTFWVTTLFSPDGFRWGSVNSEFKHKGMVWYTRCFPKHFLREESGKSKVGVAGRFLMVWWFLVKFAIRSQKYGFFRANGYGEWIERLVWIPFGALSALVGSYFVISVGSVRNSTVFRLN